MTKFEKFSTLFESLLKVLIYSFLTLLCVAVPVLTQLDLSRRAFVAIGWFCMIAIIGVFTGREALKIQNSKLRAANRAS
jgi:hypothetical protein